MFVLYSQRTHRNLIVIVRFPLLGKHNDQMLFEEERVYFTLYPSPLLRGIRIGAQEP